MFRLNCSTNYILTSLALILAIGSEQDRTSLYNVKVGRLIPAIGPTCGGHESVNYKRWPSLPLKLGPILFSSSRRRTGGVRARRQLNSSGDEEDENV